MPLMRRLAGFSMRVTAGEDVCLSLCLFVLSLFDEVDEYATHEEIGRILYEVTAGEDVCLSLCLFVLSLFDEVDEYATHEEIGRILYEVTAGEDVLLVSLFVCVKFV